LTPGAAPRPGKGLSRILLIVLVQLVFSVAILPTAASAAASVRGAVLDEAGSPIEGATVSAWIEEREIASVRTGQGGEFELEAVGDLIAVYVFADDRSTPGVDYLPLRAEVTPGGGTLRLTLVPGASLVFEGDIQFVESEDLPLSTAYIVLDPTTGEAMRVNGAPLVYGTTREGIGSFLGLEPAHLVVPAESPFTVKVNCSLLVGSEVVSRSFGADEPGRFRLERGELAAVDVRLYSISFNVNFVEAYVARVESTLGMMERMGFYLTLERKEAASAARLLSESQRLLKEERYIDSFDAAKRSYIALRQTLTGLEALNREAALSVYILIFFLALTSSSITFLFSDRRSTKLAGSPMVYAVALAILHLTYPGSAVVPPKLFALSALLALGASLAAATLLPRVLRGGGRDGHVPLRNIVVPIFSLAKRTIRRRRLRFALTLTSITVLVMSFVALTSLSENYGLAVSRVSGQGLPVSGVLLRAPGYTEEEPTFLPLSDVDLGWLERQPEVRAVSPKAENYPLTRPVITLNAAPIFGIIGIDPRAESTLLDLKGVVLEGDLPSEGEIMISEVLREELGVERGEGLTLVGMQVTLRGIFDDEAFRRLRDLDGSGYLPTKLVSTGPEGDVPVYTPAPCEPSEIVVVHLSDILGIPAVGVTSIGIAVTEGTDVDAFAERLALERGYWAWSASADGVYFARLGSYLEGRGLPLVVPWGIVVLNVVVTMLNSMYERRREVHILSSVGLNPAQIAAIFVAEASIIGIIAGGAGYLAGLTLYRTMAYFHLTLEVHHKVSALWSLAAIGVAMTTVLMGAFAALRSSVIITPSLMREWRIEGAPATITEPWVLTIPVRILPEEQDGFVEFTVEAIRAEEDNPLRRTEYIRVSTDSGDRTQVNFIYRATEPMAGNFYTKNTLRFERGPEGDVIVELVSHGERSWAHATGTLIRMIAMEWSTRRGRPGSRR